MYFNPLACKTGWVRTFKIGCFSEVASLQRLGLARFHYYSIMCNLQGVKDWHMVMVVALITGIGVLLLTIEASFPPLRPNLALLRSGEHGSGQDVSDSSRTPCPHNYMHVYHACLCQNILREVFA